MQVILSHPLQHDTSGSATSSTMRSLYAVSCKDNPEVSWCSPPLPSPSPPPPSPIPAPQKSLLLCVQVYQCLGACLYAVCNTSLSGPGAADKCSSGLTGIVRGHYMTAGLLGTLTCIPFLVGSVVQLLHLLF